MQFQGFKVMEYNSEVQASCGCPECNVTIQQGRIHDLCSTSPAVMLEAEERGEVYRRRDEDGWHWYLSSQFVY